MEEPINLSIKKSQHCTSPSELLSNTSCLPVNARMRQPRSKEGTRLLIISFWFLFFFFFFFFLGTVHHKHGKAICLLIYLHVNVLFFFQQASNIIRVLNPMEKCVRSHLWRKNMEIICFEFVTCLICEAERSVSVWSTWSVSSLRSTPVNEACSYDYWRAGLKSPNSIKKTHITSKM